MQCKHPLKGGMYSLPRDALGASASRPRAAAKRSKLVGELAVLVRRPVIIQFARYSQYLSIVEIAFIGILPLDGTGYTHQFASHTHTHIHELY